MGGTAKAGPGGDEHPGSAPATFPGTEAEARRCLCAIGRELYESALIGGRSGNLSVRLDPFRLLVTLRGIHKGRMEPGELVVVPLAGRDSEAEARATSELPFHRAAYRARPDVAAAVHTHAPALLAAGLRGIEVTAPFPEIEATLGDLARVPFRPSGSEELAAAVAKAAGRGPGTADVLLLERHGVLALGATPEEARDRTELAELTAWAALLSTDAPLELDVARVAELYVRVAERLKAGDRRRS